MEGIPGGPAGAHPLARGGVADATDPTQRSQRLQILATEHWNLLATRSLSWTESFSRASMFLTVLSGAVVSLALVAQATSFGEGFVVFALLILPVVLIVGITTYVRLVEVNSEDVHWVYGMNLIRHAYLDMEPDLEPYFISGSSIDEAGIVKTYGSHGTGSIVLHGLVTTPATIAFVNGMVAAVLGVVALIQWQMTMLPAAGLGAVIFVAVCAAQIVFARWSDRRYQAEHARRDPTGD